MSANGNNNNRPDDAGTGPIRGPDGKFVPVPDSMPKGFRPDTEGSSLHVYGKRSQAEGMAKKLPDSAGVKTVKRDGKVEFHVQHKQVSAERGGASVEVKVTRPASVEDFAEQ